MSALAWPRRRWGRALLLLVGGGLLWTLLVCYPNPAVFFRNLARYRRLPLDPAIEREMEWGLPNDPAEIERFLDQVLVPTSDWQQYRVPWYVPTAREVAASLHGDCESKTVLLASLLTGKHIPFEVRASLSHIWVDYAGRRERPGERPTLAYLEGTGGRLGLRWPKATDWKTFCEVQQQLLWREMPPLRRILWTSGMLWLVLLSFAAGVPRPQVQVASQWRPSRRLYLESPVALFGLQVLLLLGLALSGAYLIRIPWPYLVLEWNATALVLMWALAWLVFRFLPPRRLGMSITEAHLLAFSTRLGGRRLRRLPLAELHHVELLAPRTDEAPWTLAAVLRSGARYPLLHYRREPAAREVLRSLAKQLSLPLVIRAERTETSLAVSEFGLPLARRLGDDFPSVPPRPKDLDLVEEVGEGRWALHYPVTHRRLRWALLGMALLPAMLFGAASWQLGTHARWLLSWIGWLLAGGLLCTTAYLLLLGRDEMVARLANATVEIAGDRFRFLRPDGRAEQVPVAMIETVELGRVRGVPTVAVVTPGRVLHVRGLFAEEDRPWVQAVITAAIVAAQRRAPALAPALLDGPALDADLSGHP